MEVEPYKIVIATLLSATGLGYLLYEFVKDTGTEITLDKLVAIPVVLFCFLVVCLSATLEAGLLAVGWLVVSFGMIWFGDELGSNTGFGLFISSRQTPGFLVRILGWIFLMGPVCWAVGMWIAGY
jgi:hypothetical protein